MGLRNQEAPEGRACGFSPGTGEVEGLQSSLPPGERLFQGPPPHPPRTSPWRQPLLLGGPGPYGQILVSLLPLLPWFLALPRGPFKMRPSLHV